MSAVYVTVGGFLGAGKTTAMLGLAELLAARGLRVGLITNDQSSGLVDTRSAAARGYAVREITDGCFCCRFASLIEAAESLTREVRPDVFLAEPVGSCTDLRATVQLPLQRLYGDAYRVAPLSVLVVRCAPPARSMSIPVRASRRACSTSTRSSSRKPRSWSSTRSTSSRPSCASASSRRWRRDFRSPRR